MCVKSNMETYNTIWEFAVCLRKLKQGLYQPCRVVWGGRQEGGSKGRGYIYIHLWLIHDEV